MALAIHVVCWILFGFLIKLGLQGVAESSIERGIQFDIGVVDKSHGLFAWEKFEGVSHPNLRETESL